jgi:NADPH-dependent ferric siderophore reductase
LQQLRIAPASPAAASDRDVRWLVLRDEIPGSALLAEFATFDWPAGDGRVYVACEAIAMRRIRGTIRERSGLDRERIVTRGYWKLGDVNHPDHIFAED